MANFTPLFYALLFYLVLASAGYAQNMASVKTTIEYLCSPDLAGRGYLEQGDQKAAAWIGQELANRGVKPLRDTYFQSFNLSINTFPKEPTLKIGKKNLVYGVDFLVQPFSKAGSGKAVLIPLDAKILQDKTLREKTFGQNFENGAVLTRTQDFDALLEVTKTQVDKIRQAPVYLELEAQKLTASVAQNPYNKPIFKLSPAWSFLMDNPAKTTLKYQVAPVWIEQYTSQNVVGMLEGKLQPDSFLVVTAHYDHLGKIGKKVYFPGANDNAAGIAMLLELADYFVQNPPNYSVLFIAFGAEEAGLIGSKYFVENPWIDLKAIKLLVNLDLIGTGDDGMTVVNGTVFPAIFQRIEEINAQHNFFSQVKARGVAFNSDHYYFSEQNVPAIFIYLMGGIKAYHDIDDRPETLPLTKFQELFQLLIKLLQ
jgi:hypothetical protein